LKNVSHNCYIVIGCYGTYNITLVDSPSCHGWVSYEWSKSKQLGTHQESSLLTANETYNDSELVNSLITLT